MIWILFTLLAAFSQAWRNAFQKQLSQTVDAYGVTLARFIFASPLSLVYLLTLYWISPNDLPQFSSRYWLFIAIACFSQIIATLLMVRLFQLRNYAIGVGLVKSEAIVAAIIAAILLSENLSLMGWAGVILGAIAVLMLSGSFNLKGISWSSAVIGLASGSAFAITSLSVREASNTLTLGFMHNAAWVLFTVITIQALFLIAALAIFQPSTLTLLRHNLKLTGKISASSFIGSVGWFTAFSVQTVAIVKTLGQIEIFFTLAISAWFFKEKLIKRDKLGLILVAVSAILVIWSK